MNKTMTVKEIIEQLSKIPSDKELEIIRGVHAQSFQLQLYIVLPMELTVKTGELQ